MRDCVLTLFLNHVEILVEHVVRQFSAGSTAVSCFILSKMIVTLQVKIYEKKCFKNDKFQTKNSLDYKPVFPVLCVDKRNAGKNGHKMYIYC